MDETLTRLQFMYDRKISVLVAMSNDISQRPAIFVSNPTNQIVPIVDDIEWLHLKWMSCHVAVKTEGWSNHLEAE